MNNKVFACFLFLMIGFIGVIFIRHNSSLNRNDIYQILKSTRKQILVSEESRQGTGNRDAENLLVKTMSGNMEKLTSVVQHALQQFHFMNKLKTNKKNHTTTINPLVVDSESIDEIQQKREELNMNSCPKNFTVWYDDAEDLKNVDEIVSYNQQYCTGDEVKQCEEKILYGPLAVHLENYTWLHEEQMEKVNGWWSPSECKPKEHVVIVIPYREREQHLSILLHHLHPILQRQNLHYRILVVEQGDNSTFNRAKLMNVGFKEALKYFPYDCFIFHDVDLIPEDDRIEYTCRLSPKHMSVGVSTFRYRLPYSAIFGGVTALTREQFEKVNGYPNSFWEWGGEDDNLSRRITNNGFKIRRQSVKIARYKMLGHQSNRGKSMWKFLLSSMKFTKKDGLNSLQYEIMGRHIYPMYTLVNVDLRKDKDTLYKVIEANIRSKVLS